MRTVGWEPLNAKLTRRGVTLALIIVPPLAYFTPGLKIGDKSVPSRSKPRRRWNPTQIQPAQAGFTG
jgi:hypothetical protein